jgi:FkbM family methyltransferase
VKIEIAGRHWYISGMNDEVYALKEVWAKQVYALPEGFELRGGAVVDIGANVGGFSVYASQWPGRGKIFSIEPQPKVFACLAANTANIPDLQRVNVAMSDYYGMGFIATRDGNTGSGRLAEDGTIRVRVDDAYTTLWRLGVRDIDVLKIDTEGSEVPILRSLHPYLHQTRLIMLEWHSAQALQEIKEMLRDWHVTVHARSEKIGTLEAQPCCSPR